MSLPAREIAQAPPAAARLAVEPGRDGRSWYRRMPVRSELYSLDVARMAAGAASIPRNPRLFTAMAHLGYVQNFGMGVRTIVDETTRLKRPARVSIDVDETVLTFPRKRKSPA